MLLTDGEQVARDHPETFMIPSTERRQALQVGELVKLGFWPRVAPESGPNAERMWVRVDRVARDADGVLYTGTLDNEPTVVPEMKCGDTVQFRPKHVLSTWA